MDTSFQWLTHYNFIHLESVDSTNTEALRMARLKADQDHIITADRQEEGRGSKGRFWRSPLGNINLTILLCDVSDLRSYLIFPFIIAIVLEEVISEYDDGNNKVTLKWPNDILINNRKVAGILVESINVYGKNYVAIGVGINARINPNIGNRQIATTSLLAEGIVVSKIQEMINAIINSFDHYYDQWQIYGDFTFIRERWMQKAHRLGKLVEVKTQNKTTQGVFQGIDDQGRLVIKADDGEMLYYDNCQLTYI